MTVELFFTSLAEPFTQLYASQAGQVHEKGAVQYAKEIAHGIGSGVANHPLDAATLITSLFIGANVGEYTEVVNAAYVATGVTKNIKQIAHVLSSDCSRVQKVVMSAVCLTAILSLPKGTEAADYKTLQEAEAAYVPGECAKESGSLWEEATSCLKEGGYLAECIPPGDEHDVYKFTRHESMNPQLDPVSVVRLDSNRTCYLTSLHPEAPVIQTCFWDLFDPQNHTVTVIDGLVLQHAHEGLEPGQSVQHMGLVAADGKCGLFRRFTDDIRLGFGATCLLTSSKQGDPVSQACFDPRHPERLLLREAKDFRLIGEDGKPSSAVIEQPERLGLNLNRDRYYTLWEVLNRALTWWWTQTPPFNGEL